MADRMRIIFARDCNYVSVFAFDPSISETEAKSALATMVNVADLVSITRNRMGFTEFKFVY